MTKIIAMKIHYDHRKSLPSYLKYSKVPTKDEYNEYFDLYYQEGIGGEGFHECLNFAIPESCDLKMYLPPTCIPGKDKRSEEFLIFSFTYKGDKELSSAIIGIHGKVSIIDPEGIPRNDYKIEGIKEELKYYAVADSEMSTIFTTPIDYDFKKGRHTPSYVAWGQGRRYIELKHAGNIIRDAHLNAQNRILVVSETEKIVIAREIEVLEKVYSKYFKGRLSKERDHEGRGVAKNPPVGSGPDREIGYKGELEVYNREVKYAESIGLDASSVEWLSQSVPTAVFDIKTIRKVEGIVIDHFVEVKSSKLEYGESIYLSSRQLEYFRVDKEKKSLALVNFYQGGCDVVYRSIDEVEAEFDFSPIKYQLSKKVV